MSGMQSALAAIAARDRITGDQAARNRIAEGLERLALAHDHAATESAVAALHHLDQGDH